VERSGLARYFEAVEVVPEKDAKTYSALVDKYGLARDTSWMVGNSPRSDVNPALAAGLNAVFVPHADTWILEHEELCQVNPPQVMLHLDSFGDLRKHF
jgi:putative hydrolase of the HAD superfamily